MRPLTPVPSCKLIARRRAQLLGGTTVSAVVLATVLSANPAFAAASTAQSKADLAAQFSLAPAYPAGAAPTEIALGQSLTTTDYGNEILTTPAHSVITLDMQGHQMQLQQLTVGTGATLLLTDSTITTGSYSYDSGLSASRTSSGPGSTATGIVIGSGATLHVDKTRVSASGSDNAAGIGSPAAVTAGAGDLVVTGGASVYGTGGSGGAGIGGAPNAAAIGVSVTDSFVSGYGGAGGAGIGSGRNGVSFDGLDAGTTPITQNADGDSEYHSSYVGATGGAGGAGIGGGFHAVGGAVALSGNTSATADGKIAGGAPVTPNAVGAGQDSAGTFGSLDIGAGASLRVPSTSALAVPAGVTVHNAGSIDLAGTASGDGTIDNSGSIDLDRYSSTTASTQIDPGSRVTVAHVTGHNYSVALDTNGGTPTGYTSARVFSKQLSTSSLPEPTAPEAGKALLNWNTRADGSGDDPNYQDLEDLTGDVSTDGTPVPLTIYAHYGVLPYFTSTSMPAAGLGAAYDQPFPVAGDGIYSSDVSSYDEEGDSIPGLPAGLGVDYETGHVTGTPTEAGTYRFLVRTYGRKDLTGYVTMQVAGAPVIATGSLPDGQQGAGYSTLLVASGDGTIAWSVAPGSSLPAGLALSGSGVLSGTPTGSGRSTFSLQAASEFGPTVQPFSFAAAAAAPAAPAAASPAATSSAPAVQTPPAAAPTVAAPAPGTPAAAAPFSAAAAPVTAPVPVPAPVSAAPAPAPAPAAPRLAAVGRTVVRFGHRLDLAVAASSTVAVRYAVSGDLPNGVSFDRTTGAFSGVVGEVGTFDSTVTASSSAGSASTPVRIVVPQIQELIDAKPVPAVAVGARTVPVRVSGFKKGERWRVLVNGAVVRSGVMKRAGALKTSVVLKGGQKDVAHRVVVTTSRRVTDPAKSAATTFTVTTLTAKKHLQAGSASAGRGLVTVKVAKLGAGERVTVTEKAKVVARGVADAAGRFSFVSKQLAKGVHRLMVRGATSTRSDSLTVKPSSH